MRIGLIGSMLIVVLSGCHVHQRTDRNETAASQLARAEAFVDVFYSFDSAKLKAALASAEESLPKIGFYQGWAEGGNYRVVKRERCVRASAQEVRCAVTVKDDLIPALGLNLDVTDTFHITFAGDTIVSVRTTSNDPPLFAEALQWVARTKPDVLTGPCRGFFDGGPTPADCVRAVVHGFAEFSASRP